MRIVLDKLRLCIHNRFLNYTIFVTRGFDVTYSVAMSVVINLGIPVGVAIMESIIDKFPRKVHLCITLPLSGIAGFAWSMIPANQTILIMAVGFVMAALVYYWSLIVSSVYLPSHSN